MSTLTRSGTARPLAALLAAGLLLLGACSSDGGDDSSASSTTATTAAGAGSTTEADGTTTAPDETGTTEPESPSTTGGATPAGDEGAFTTAVADALALSLEPIEDGQATCIAEGWVDTVGFDRFEGAGSAPDAIGQGDSSAWSPLEIDDDEADELYATVEDCGYDFPAAIRDSLTAGKSAEQAACLGDALTDELAADFMKTSFQGSSSETELTSLAEKCE